MSKVLQQLLNTSARFALVLGLTGIAQSCGSPTGDAANLDDLGIVDPSGPRRPGQAAVRGEQNFAVLINTELEGQPKNHPWAGSYWPYVKNGIAARTDGGFSAAGKYDAVRGCQTKAQDWEVGNHGSKVHGVEGWWGHCNGWSAAAALFPEPREDKKINGVNFTVADQKALLTEGSMLASADFYGERVGPASPSWHFDDTIPNMFFLVLTNYMGREQHPVLLDADSGIQVWNQPVAGYRLVYPKAADYLGAHPDFPNVYRINISGTVYWANDGVDPGTLTTDFKWDESNPYHFTAREYRAELWLDGPVEFDAGGKITKSGNIFIARKDNHPIGGDWKSDHPDYMWVPFSVLNPASPVDNPTDGPDPNYANRNIDIRWVIDHLVNGQPETSVSPCPVPTAPAPEPSHSPSPHPNPSPHP